MPTLAEIIKKLTGGLPQPTENNIGRRTIDFVGNADRQLGGVAADLIGGAASLIDPTDGDVNLRRLGSLLHPSDKDVGRPSRARPGQQSVAPVEGEGFRSQLSQGDRSAIQGVADPFGAQTAAREGRFSDVLPRNGMYSQRSQPQESPYAEFMQGYMSDLAGSYDAQIDAIAGLGPLFRDQANEAQGNIGSFFGYAGDVAREGIPVTQETYDTAISNVGGVYDQLGERLESMPQNLVNVASEAAGGAVGSSVAGRVAAATAPFAAAGESARANAVANLTQHSAAGQNYLNQLASSTGAEAAMGQSAVEQALNQQMQLVAFRQAEIEGAKHRALMEVSKDIAGESSERMANAALAQALGIDLPGGGAIDPLDYLRGQGALAGLQGDQISQQQAMLNLTRDMNPGWQQEQVLSGMSGGARGTVDQIRRIAETSFQEGDDPRNLGIHMIRVLDDMSREFGNKNYTGEGTPLDEALGEGEIPVTVGDPATRKKIEEAIRALYS